MVNPNNQGTITLPEALNFPTDNFTDTFSFTLSSFSNTGVARRGHLIWSNDLGKLGTGIFLKQDPAAFSTAAVNAGYAFGFAGGGNNGPVAANGRFTASGGAISSGQIDLNTSGTAAANLPFDGTFAVGASGRGTVALKIPGQPGSSNFIFHAVSASELLFMSSDASLGSTLSGLALQQSAAPFAANSLNGAAVFNLAGLEGSGTDVAVGQETFDGSGGLGGTSDENKAGVITSNMAFTGTYTMDANGLGRGVLTTAGHPNSTLFYLVSPSEGFMITTGIRVESGVFELQTGDPLSDASLSGNYAIGAIPAPMNSIQNGIFGALTANSVGSLSGSSDAASLTFTGTYSVVANGRTTLAITPSAGAPSNLVFYLISPSKAVGIPLDAGAANSDVEIIEK